MCPEWSPLHFDKGREMADRFILPAIGHLPAFTLEKDAIKTLLGTPAKPSMVRHLRAAVGSMLTWAYSEEWTANPREYYLPKKPRTAKRAEGRQRASRPSSLTRACGRARTRARSSRNRCSTQAANATASACG